MLDLKKSNFENTVLVGVTNSSQDEFKLNEYLEELEFLTRTAGGTVVKKFKQKVVNPNPKLYGSPSLSLSNSNESFSFFNIFLMSLIRL